MYQSCHNIKLHVITNLEKDFAQLQGGLFGNKYRGL